MQGGRWVQSCICIQLNLKSSPWNRYGAYQFVLWPLLGCTRRSEWSWGGLVKQCQVQRQCPSGCVHSGVLILGRCEERGLFCLQNVQKTDCIQVIGKKHAILQQHWQLHYWRKKNISNIARYLLLRGKNLTLNVLNIGKGYLWGPVGNMAACRPGLKHWISKWLFRISIKNVTNFEKFFILPRLQMVDSFHCVWLHT